MTWWVHGGTTDLNNGVLACTPCHHLVHDQGGDIRVEGLGVDAEVWQIPAAHIDPVRTPRPAARRRVDFVPAA